MLNSCLKFAVQIGRPVVRKVLLVCVLAVFPGVALADVLLAAASSVRAPVESLISTYKNQTGNSVRVSYGSSGNLTHQILRGAPYDIFLSADLGFPQKLYQNLEIDEPIIYARGSLDLYASNKSNCDVNLGIAGLLSQVEAGAIKHIAIANPELAPYGRAAMQVLEHSMRYEQLKDKLVFAESVAQVNLFVQSGAVDVGLTAYSSVTGPTAANIGAKRLASTYYYDPIRQGALVLGSDTAASSPARQFVSYLCSPEATPILSTFGYNQAP